MLLYGALVPHPPIIIEEIGGGETAKAEVTVSAMVKLADRIKELSPETILVLSSHGPVFQDGLAIRGGEKLAGDLYRFGSSLSWEWENHHGLVLSIIEEAKKEGVYSLEITEDLARRYRISEQLDHGVLVPLSFLSGLSFRLVATGMSLLSWRQQYQIGMAIGRAVRKSRRRIVVLASGDLSHCLKPGAPAPYDPSGEEFDRQVVKVLGEGRLEEFFNLSPNLVDKAAECGFRPLLMLAGVFEGQKIKNEVFSYEGPFGVGYAVAGITPGPEDPERLLLPTIRQQEKDQISIRRAKESFPVRLARRTIEDHLLAKEHIDDEDISAEFTRRAGVFVSIKKHGQLRGCIGTIFPTEPTLVEEVKKNAISAAFHDPRFEPIQEEELPDLVYSVDLLGTPEPVRGPQELDPKKYGVIIRKGARSGLLLPNLEGIDTVEEQIRIAKRKAGLREGDQVEMERFEVLRYY